MARAGEEDGISEITIPLVGREQPFSKTVPAPTSEVSVPSPATTSSSAFLPAQTLPSLPSVPPQNPSDFLCLRSVLSHPLPCIKGKCLAESRDGCDLLTSRLDHTGPGGGGGGVLTPELRSRACVASDLGTWLHKHLLNKSLRFHRAEPPHYSPPLRPSQDQTHCTGSMWLTLCCLDFP